MHQSKHFEFERVAREFAGWRRVPEPQRSQAAGWWWGLAMALRQERQRMPLRHCRTFGLPSGACYADAARRLMELMAAQAAPVPPADFPRQRRPAHDEPSGNGNPSHSGSA